VSYYALFKGWLLLSQLPACIRRNTTFPTECRFRDLRWRSWAVSLSNMELSPHVLTADLAHPVFVVWLGGVGEPPAPIQSSTPG